MTTSRKLGMMRKAKWNNLNSSTTVTIYKSFIRPNLEYCSPIWGTAAQSNLRILHSLQNKAISSLPLNLHYALGIQSLRHRRQVTGLTVFRKMQCSLLAYPLDSLKLPQLKAYRSTRQSSASHQHRVVIPKSRTSHHQRSFFSFLCQALELFTSLCSGCSIWSVLWLICHLLRIYELWLGHPPGFLFSWAVF